MNPEEMTEKDMHKLAQILEDRLVPRIADAVEQRLEVKLEQKLNQKLDEKLKKFEQKFDEKLAPIAHMAKAAYEAVTVMMVDVAMLRVDMAEVKVDIKNIYKCLNDQDQKFFEHMRRLNDHDYDINNLRTRMVVVENRQ